LFSETPPVDAGNDAVCLPVDQRHLARAGTCDMGAFEYNGFTPIAKLTILHQTNQVEVLLSWPTAVADFSLQSTPSLPPASWTTVTNPAVVVGANYVVTNNVDAASRFYRLSR